MSISYTGLADRLIEAYTKNCIARAPQPVARTSQERQLARSLFSLAHVLDQYRDPVATNLALDTIDLAAIYAGVDAKEASKPEDSPLQYEDLLVQQTLDYFKNTFFKWITKPECTSCHESGDNMVHVSTVPFEGAHNPDDVSVVETYRCERCSRDVQFPRINNPASLLRSRQGRCGEWVNCFLLIMHALMADPNRLRYVWNNEDHVWCEYYSNGLGRWVHLDPCEGAFDEPLIYANNWGKKMSLVVGFNDYYAIDLSPKYIPPKAQIDLRSILTSPKLIKDVIAAISYIKLRAFSDESPLLDVYNSVLLPHNKELKVLQKIKAPAPPAASTSAPQGRQSGDPDWTKARGENG